MAQTDSVADFLTRVRNASFVKKDTVECPSSNTNKKICQILKMEGFIKDYREMKDNRQNMLRLYLKYSKEKDRTPAISNLKRVSKPSLRIYEKHDELPVVLGGRGIAIVSTSKGILTDNECREMKVGGEVLCLVW
ncbi:MAG: 30S ribosomal protein S8 [Candidatus Omnitrophota bacterium]